MFAMLIPACARFAFVFAVALAVNLAVLLADLSQSAKLIPNMDSQFGGNGVVFGNSAFAHSEHHKSHSDSPF